MRKKRHRGHHCRICHRRRPNEQFSCKGRRLHVCKECARVPKTERDAIQQTDEIFGFLQQRNISKKNGARLAQLTASSDPRVAELALAVHELACARPRKRKRYRGLRRLRPALMDMLEQVGVLEPRIIDPWWDEPAPEELPLFIHAGYDEGVDEADTVIEGLWPGDEYVEPEVLEVELVEE